MKGSFKIALFVLILALLSCSSMKMHRVSGFDQVQQLQFMADDDTGADDGDSPTDFA